MIALQNEKLVKVQIQRFLAEQGYPRYSAMLNNFDINLTADPNIVAYVEQDRARIVLNKNLYLEQVSVVIRHELLHRFLDHFNRLWNYVGPERKSKWTYGDQELANIAADYEISNRGYTEKDKKDIKNLYIGDTAVSGLVTEDKHPEWVDLTFEEMYQKLADMKEHNDQVLKDFFKELFKKGLYDDGKVNKGPQNSSNQSSNSHSPDDPYNKDEESDSNGSDITDIEDIIRGLKSGLDSNREAQQNNGKEGGEDSPTSEQRSQLNDALGKLIDQAQKALDDLLKNPSLSKEKKDKLLDDLKKAVEQSNLNKQEDNPADQKPEYDKKGTEKEVENNQEQAERKLERLAKDIERNAAREEEKAKYFNKDFDRSQIDQNIKERISNIDDLFKDSNEIDSILSETEETAFKRSQSEKQSKNEFDKKFKGAYSRPYNAQDFLSSLRRLINTQVKRDLDFSYKRPAKKQVFGSQKIIFKGKGWDDKQRKKPKVVVYYDRSGSWQNAYKTKAGDDAIKMLNNEFVKKGLIEVTLRYFANTVSDSPESVGFGNGARQEILDDIVKQGATNVIIMTDSDIDDPSGYPHPVTVPGGVFFLFCDGESPAIVKKLHGKQLNKVFNIDTEYKHI